MIASAGDSCALRGQIQLVGIQQETHCLNKIELYDETLSKPFGSMSRRCV